MRFKDSKSGDGGRTIVLKGHSNQGSPGRYRGPQTFCSIDQPAVQRDPKHGTTVGRRDRDANTHAQAYGYAAASGYIAADAGTVANAGGIIHWW